MQSPDIRIGSHGARGPHGLRMAGTRLRFCAPCAIHPAKLRPDDILGVVPSCEGERPSCEGEHPGKPELVSARFRPGYG